MRFPINDQTNMSLAETSLPDRVSQDTPGEDVYDDGYLRVEHANYYLACGGQSLHLRRTEFLLLSRLVRSIDRVVRSEELWRTAWGNSKPLNSESLHVYIYRLRNRLLPYNLQIGTLVNVGYRLLRSHPKADELDNHSTGESFEPQS